MPKNTGRSAGLAILLAFLLSACSETAPPQAPQKTTTQQWDKMQWDQTPWG